MLRSDWLCAVAVVLLFVAAASATPINYTDAAGNLNWSSPAAWDQNSSYPGANDPADTAVIDQGTKTVNVNVPLMGMITVNSGGKILASMNLTNVNTVTVNSGGQVEFDAGYPNAQKYYWNMLLNNGALWYGNLHQDGGMYGNFTIGDSATVTIRHSGAQYNTGRLNGTISGPATSTISFEAVSYVNDMSVSGTNTNLLCNLNIKCPVTWGTSTPLGPNTGGAVRVLPNGVIRQSRAYGSSSATLARDLTFAGGSSWNTTHPDYNITYSGQWTLQADTPLTVDTSGGNIGYVIVSGRITQDATPRKLNAAMTGSGAPDGKLELTNPSNNFSGGLSVDAGNLYITTAGAQGAGPLTLTNGAEVFLDASPNASWSLANNIGGVGAVQVEDASTSYTLTANGSALSPGTSATSTGTLTVRGNLAFAANGGTPASLNIDVVGTGSPVVVTNDVLAVTRNVSGLSNAALNVSLSGVTGNDVKGKTFTILTCANDMTGQSFGAVNCPAGWVAMVTYNNGAIYLQLAPQGQAQPAMQLSASQPRFRATAASPVPAAQSVTVKNIGFGTLHWTAAARSPAPSWLTITNAGGTDNQAFTLSVDRTGLADGTYTAWVDVTDPGAANSPQSVLVVLQALPATIVSTHSFTNNATRGTHPGTLTTAGNTITVNMASLPAGATVYRAQLAPHLSGNSNSNSRANSPMQIQAADAPGVWLQAAGPRYLTLDCTAAVQRAMASSRTLALNVISWPGWNSGQLIRLDVWCDQPPVNAPQQVTNLAAVHRSGDTMLTFTEVEQPISTAPITGPGYDTAMNAINANYEIRYRVYRGSAPIDATSIRTAELVDEISPLSCWNTNYDQQDWNTRVVPALPIADMTQAAPGTGIYVNRAKAAGSSGYAVSRVVDGEEDLSNWIQGFNTLGSSVTETLGTGMALQWQQAGPVSFSGVNNAMKYYFIKWECPPNYNVPSTPHNYLVAVPPTAADPRPVNVGLHEWGGSMETVAWTEPASGSLLVATNQVPYDWWTAFHENSGTLRPFTDVEGNGGGRVRPYSENRIWSFVNDFVAGRWNINANRILVRGGSMGGSGASMWGVRANEKFSYIVSQVGVHIPAMSPTFTSSFEGDYGLVGWGCLYADTGLAAFDYWDNNQWLRSHVGQDIPFITFANGKNDGGIGWPQARLMAIACQETRRPHVFTWGQNGHLQGVTMPGTGGDLQLAKNKTLPAFTYCSLDNNPGNGSDTDGDPAGTFNAYLWWQQDDSTDTASTWEMTCLLIGSAPQATCTVDVTPRRCQAFKPAVGKVCSWTNTDIATGTVIASGTATVDANGLITLPQMTVSKTKNRLKITAPSLVGDINGDGYVNVSDLQLLVAAWASQKTPPSSNWNAAADLNGDGFVNVGDLQILIAHWGQ